MRLLGAWCGSGFSRGPVCPSKTGRGRQPRLAGKQMGGQGNFSDPRLDIDVKHTPDQVTSKLPALRAYQHSLPAPKEWDDLKKPIYAGHVGISAPSRSGTTQLTVETLLQGEGWEKGWATLLEIGGNFAQVSDRSFGVPDAVNSGQYGIGIVIDFFGLAAKTAACNPRLHIAKICSTDFAPRSLLGDSLYVASPSRS